MSALQRPGVQNFLIAASLCLLAFVLVFVAQRNQGIARDEVVYMNAGTRYANYWVDLVHGKDGVRGEEAITRAFGGPRATDGNREHPPLMKTFFGFSELLFHQKLGWMSKLSASRLPSALCNGLLVALVFLFVVGRWGRAPALFSALFVLFLPRAFFHSGFATFDGPVVLFWFASIQAYLVALRHRMGFLLLGLCLGLSLATKHNAVLLPAALLPHYLVFAFFHGRARWRERREAGGFPEPRWQSLFHALAAARPQVLLSFRIALLVLVALWPWLWFERDQHMRDWMTFHLQHVHYNFEYLGTNWNAPPFPWHVPIVTTLLTVPLATSVLGLGGLVAAVQGWRRKKLSGEQLSACALLFLSAGVSLGPFLLRTTPIFGAEKHWAAAMPSLCIFAGLGLWWAIERARAIWEPDASSARGKKIALSLALGLGSLPVAAAAYETCIAQPYALSHYNALAGGAPGGARLGMNRQFWGYSARGVMDYLNQFAIEGGTRRVYTHDASPAWGYYRQEGILHPSLVDAGSELSGIRGSEIAIVIHEKHFARHEFMIWQEYGKLSPSFVLQIRGVPLVSVYVRDLVLAENREARPSK